MHWFLGGKGLGIQQGTSVWVASPKSTFHIEHCLYCIVHITEKTNVLARLVNGSQDDNLHVDSGKQHIMFGMIRNLLPAPPKYGVRLSNVMMMKS